MNVYARQLIIYDAVTLKFTTQLLDYLMCHWSTLVMDGH